MNLAPLYKAYALFFNGAGCILNLFLIALFLRAYLRHRDQLAFLIFALGCICAAFTTGYLFASGIQHQYSIELFPLPVWRILAYVFFVAEPLVFLSTLVGPLVLVRTYGRNSSQASHGRNI